jgi:hypothetical protein
MPRIVGASVTFEPITRTACHQGKLNRSCVKLETDEQDAILGRTCVRYSRFTSRAVMVIGVGSDEIPAALTISE